MASVLDAFVKFLADEKDIDDALNKRIPQKAGEAGRKAGTAFSQAMSKVTTVAGAAGGALFASAIEGATAFEDQLRTIQTVVPDLNLDKTGKEILALSRETGKSTDDLTAGFYDLVSAGVAADDAINVLRDSAKFATGALGTTAESVDLVTSVMNAYQLEAKDSARITDVFAKAVADGKVTAAELGSSIAQIAPIASSAGVSIEEVSSGFALLTARGVPATQAATQMRAAISGLLTPNETLNKLQDKTKKNFADIAREKGLAVALEELRLATEGNNDEFAKSLGSIDAYQFALATTGDQAAAFAEQIVDTADSAGLATDQYNIKASSAAEAGNRFAASIKAFLIEFGAPFVQTMGPALQTLNLLGPAFGRGGIAGKAFGAVLGGIAGKAIPAVVGGFRKLISSIDVSVNDLPLPLLLKFDALKFRLQTAASSAGGAVGKVFAKAFGAAEGLASGVSTGLSAIKNSPAVSRATTAAGKFAGTTFGKAFGVAASVAAVAAIVLVAKDVQDAIDRQKEDLVAQAREFARTATEEQVTGSLEGLKAQMEQDLKDAAFFNSLPLGLGLAMGRAKLEGADGARQVIEAIEAEFAHARTAEAIEGALSAKNVGDAAQAVGEEIEEGIGDGADRASDRVGISTTEILTSIKGLRSDLVAQAQGVADALYDPIIKAAELAETQAELRRQKAVIADKNSTQEQIDEANRRRQELGKILITQTAEILTYGTQAEQISKTKAFLASGFWAEAYEGALPEQRLALDEWRATLETRLAEMELAASTSAVETVDKYTGTISGGKGEVSAAASTLASGIDDPLSRAAREARKHGENISENVASGMKSKEYLIANNAARVSNILSSYLHLSSPAEKGALSIDGGPGGWMAFMIDWMADVIAGGSPKLAAASGRASQAIAQGIGAYTATPVINAALGTSLGLSSAIASRRPDAAPGIPAGERHVHYHAEVTGLLKAQDPLEVAYQMERVREMGVPEPLEEDAYE